MVVDIASREFSYYGPGIPEGFEVHHLDYNKANNERHNLLMLDIRIHAAFQSDNVRQRNYHDNPARKKQQVASDMPDWVMEGYEDGEFDVEVA
jgi:hypothetical protein